MMRRLDLDLSWAGAGVKIGIVVGTFGVWKLRQIRQFGSLVRRLKATAEEESLILVALGCLTLVLAAALPTIVVGDTWLSLVDGRWIAQHGLPHHDSIAVWTRGTRWIDQQWLAHLTLYEVTNLGGLRSTLALAATLDVAAFVVATVLARRMGASPRSVALCIIVSLIVAPWFLQARTQSFALLLFVVVYGLLALHARRPTRWVLAILPLLALWENLHGSALLATGLAVVGGLVTSHREPRYGIALAVLAPFTVLATPYGLDIVGYYRRMLIGSPLPTYVTEWMPTSVKTNTAAFFVLAFGVVFLAARVGSAVSRFEVIALPLLVAVGLIATRNTGWLGLAFAVSGPALLDAAWRPAVIEATARRRFGLRLAMGLAAVGVLALAARLAEPESTLLGSWPTAGAEATAQAAGTRGLLLADDLHSDWLLWEHPDLTGRVAYDIRFELLGARHFASLDAFRTAGVTDRFTAPYRVLTFSDRYEAARAARLGAKTIFRSATLIVMRRSAPRSARSSP